MWVELVVYKSKNLLLGIVYRPPCFLEVSSEEFNEIFQNMLSTGINDSVETILLGDVNVNFFNKSEKGFKRILELYGFKQIITKPTRITYKTITLTDFIGTTNNSNIRESDVFPLSNGNYDMVGCVRKISNIKYESKLVNCCDDRNYSAETFCSELNNHDWSFLDTIIYVNNAWNKIRFAVSLL